MQVSLSDGALTETEAAIDYYYKAGAPHIASRFLEQLEYTLSILKQFPELGSVTYSETRSFPLNGFPFSVVYHLKNENLYVIAVAHHRRRPGYWRR
jgi:toxin ParE1/3/4